MLTASPMLVAAVGATSSGVASPLVGQMLAAIVDPNAILAGRSPGTRTGATVQTKLAAAPAPHERVLSAVRQRPAPEAPEAPAGLSPAALANVPLAAPGGVLAGLGPELVPLPVGSGPIAIGGPGVVPVALIGPPGDNSPVVVTTPTPTAPLPAVPEPMTWVSLLTGIGLVAARLRHKRRQPGTLLASQ